MKLLLGLLAVLALSSPVWAYEPLAYPGSSWGQLSRDLEDLEGNGTQGNVRQGVDWAKLPGDITFNTFGVYRWRFRSELRPFYNSHGPGMGFNLSRGPFDLGMDFSWINYPELRRNEEDFSLYALWFKRWDVSKWTGKPDVMLALPFSTWGRLDYDLNDIEGGGSQGWFEQGIDWFKYKALTLDTFVSYRWRLRSDNKRFYNMHGPAMGVKLQASAAALEFNYSARTYPQLHRYTNNFELLLTWYYGWNLKRK